MAIQGLRTTTNFATDQRPQNWRETVLRLYPNGKAPLTALTTLMKSEKTDDPQFNWWEKPLENRRVQMSAAITAADTTIPVVDKALSVKQGDILYIESTAELVIVTADPTIDTQIPVARGFAGTTATLLDPTAAGKNPFMGVTGSAYEEASLPPTGVSFDPTKSYNYTQIFRNSLEMSRTAQKTRLRTGDAVKEAKRETLEMHSIDMEMAFILGRRHEHVFGGKPRRSTGGIVSFIDSANIITATATTTMLQMEEYLYSIFKFGSGEKIGFLGNRALLVLNQLVRKNGTFFFESNIKEYGMNVLRFTSPFGSLVLRTHPLFNLRPGGTTAGTAYAGMESWMLVVDAENLRYRYVDDTFYEAKQEANGLDGLKSGWTTECGLEIHHPKTHFLIKGLTLGAADA